MINKAALHLEDLKRLSLHAKSYLRHVKVGELFVKGENASYLEAGSGEPLLLIHGYGGMKKHWRILMTPLMKRYRVIALEIPGLSNAHQMNRRSNFSLRFLVEYVIEFANVLGLSEFHVMGASGGSVIAVSAALKYPQKIKTLTMLGMPALYRNSDDEKTDPKQAHKFYAPKTIDEMDRLTEYLYCKPPQLPTHLKKLYLERIDASREFHNKVIEEFFTNAYQIVPRLNQIQCPCLFVYGDHDRVTPQASVDLLVDQVKNLQVYRLLDTGHVSYFENPAEVAGCFHSFIESSLQMNLVSVPSNTQ